MKRFERCFHIVKKKGNWKKVQNYIWFKIDAYHFHVQTCISMRVFIFCTNSMKFVVVNDQAVFSSVSIWLNILLNFFVRSILLFLEKRISRWFWDRCCAINGAWIFVYCSHESAIFCESFFWADTWLYTIHLLNVNVCTCVCQLNVNEFPS